MSFVTVTYGENYQEIFNPNCKTRIFLENVKKRCQCPQKMEVELADENGNLKNISTLPSLYANQILSAERELLVLIHIKRNNHEAGLESEAASDGNDVTYIPLLNNSDIINSRFKARLLNRDPESARPQSRTKRSSRDKREKSSRRSAEMTSVDKQDESNAPPSHKRGGSSRNKGGSGRSKLKGKK